MNDDFTGLRTRLAELADAPAPASPFDATRTAASGRRRVLAYRTSAAGGGGALAVAAVVGIVAAFAPGAQPASATSPTPSTDPLVRTFDFGWLPASLPNVSYVITANGDDLIAQGNIEPGGEPRIDLLLLNPGKGPGTPSGGEHFIPVTLNDGRHAFWVTQPPSAGRFFGDFQLRFPLKNGRWAALSWSITKDQGEYYEIAGTQAEEEAAPPSTRGTPPASVPVSGQWQRDLVQMATQVTDTPVREIPIPLRVTGLPSSLTSSAAMLWHPSRHGQGAPGTWNVELSFSVGPRGRTLFTFEAGPHGTLPALKVSDCTTSAGMDVCVETSGSSPDLDRLGGAKGLLNHITVLGLDQKQWTTDVIVP